MPVNILSTNTVVNQNYQTRDSQVSKNTIYQVGNIDPQAKQSIGVTYKVHNNSDIETNITTYKITINVGKNTFFHKNYNSIIKSKEARKKEADREWLNTNRVFRSIDDILLGMTGFSAYITTIIGIYTFILADLPHFIVTMTPFFAALGVTTSLLVILAIYGIGALTYHASKKSEIARLTREIAQLTKEADAHEKYLKNHGKDLLLFLENTRADIPTDFGKMLDKNNRISQYDVQTNIATFNSLTRRIDELTKDLNHLGIDLTKPEGEPGDISHAMPIPSAPLAS